MKKMKISSMKKNTWFAWLAVMLLTACSKGGYERLVPSDATFVAAINLQDIAQDADLQHSSLLNLARGYIGLVASGEDRQMVNTVMDDPSLVGIDFSSPLYVFELPNHCMGAVLKVDDNDRLDKFFEFLTKLKICSKTTKREGLIWTDLLEEFSIAYSDQALLIFTSATSSLLSNEQKKVMMQLFENERENGFCSTEHFSRMTEQAGDICIYSRMAALPASWTETLANLLPDGVRAADVDLCASLAFERGEAVFHGRLLGDNDKLTQAFAKADQHLHTIQGAFLQSLPTDFAVVATVGCDGDWLLKMLKQNEKAKHVLFMLERAVDVEAMLRSIDGDVTVTLPTFPTDADSFADVDFVAMAQVRNTDFMADYNYWKQTAKDYGIVLSEQVGNGYRIQANGIDLRWGIDEQKSSSTLYFTSAKAMQQTAFAERGRTLDAFSDDIHQSKVFVCVNLADIVRQFQRFGSLSTFGKSLLSSADFLILQSSNPDQFTLRIKAKEADTNILQQILR